MSDTESFEHAMAEMRKVVMDCDMERCDMYDGDCYQCQGDILYRMQRAHERELAQARDPQRLRGTKPNTFDGAIEALREFRWQHATNDEDAVPYINAAKEMHDHELEHVRKAEYARGFHDGGRSMDAEHYAVALRLMHLPLDGGSHENLSQIARAVWHSDFGWTQGACRALRDELVRLMGGVHEPDAVLPTYDVLGNERHKAIAELRKVRTELEESVWTWIEDVAIAIGAQDKQSDEYESMLPKITDRLIHLLGGDQPTLSDLFGIWQDGEESENSGSESAHNMTKSAEIAKPESEDGGEVTITDELREKIHEKVNQELYVVVEADDLYAIADNIDAQLKTIRQNDYDEWQLQTDKMRAMLTEQRDEARAKVLKLESENAEWRRGAERDADKLESLTGAYNDAVTENDELRKKLEELEKFDPDIAMAAYGDDNDELRRLLYRAAKLLANAERDRDVNYAYWMDCKEKVVQANVTIDELQAKNHDCNVMLNAIREAVNAV